MGNHELLYRLKSTRHIQRWNYIQFCPFPSRSSPRQNIAQIGGKRQGCRFRHSRVWNASMPTPIWAIFCRGKGLWARFLWLLSFRVKESSSHSYSAVSTQDPSVLSAKPFWPLSIFFHNPPGFDQSVSTHFKCTIDPTLCLISPVGTWPDHHV